MTVSAAARTWLYLEEAADYIGANPRHLRTLIQERRIPHYVVARRIRFLASDLDEYLATLRRPAVGF